MSIFIFWKTSLGRTKDEFKGAGRGVPGERGGLPEAGVGAAGAAARRGDERNGADAPAAQDQSIDRDGGGRPRDRRVSAAVL